MTPVLQSLQWSLPWKAEVDPKAWTKSLQSCTKAGSETFSVVVIDSASVKTRTDWDVGTGIEFASWTKTAMIARKGKKKKQRSSRGAAQVQKTWQFLPLYYGQRPSRDPSSRSRIPSVETTISGYIVFPSENTVVC